MKYAELIDGQPLPARVQLRAAERHAEARQLVEHFLISGESAQLFREQVIPWLDGESGARPGGLVLSGGAGIGKTHWMAVISALVGRARRLGEAVVPS